ncbi:MAG: hypothetical protein M3P30_08330 [Chloroflexota bacterium]|nr:hypothetical protein [Chloroflexota bacterium]
MRLDVFRPDDPRQPDDAPFRQLGAATRGLPRLLVQALVGARRRLGRWKTRALPVRDAGVPRDQQEPGLAAQYRVAPEAIMPANSADTEPPAATVWSEQVPKTDWLKRGQPARSIRRVRYS